MEAEHAAELENYYQNVFLYELCLLDGLKEEYPKSPKMQKSPIFKRKNLEKSKVKFFLVFFLIEAEHNSQNMPKCLVFLQQLEERDRLKSHSFFLPPAFY